VKRLIAFLIAVSLCLPTASSAWWQSIQQVAVSGAPPAIPSYVYRGNVFTSSASGNVVTISMNIGTASADRVVAVFIGSQNNPIVSSVVVDPTGANVSLTKNTEQDSGTGAGNTTAFWSGLVASSSGTVNIAITYTTSPNFFNMGYHVWTLTGLASNTPRAAVSGFPNLNIGVTSGYILLAGSFSSANNAVVPWTSPTETPAGDRVDSGPSSSSEDWTVISTNASFGAVIPNGSGYSAATFF
jgi:hypothetical protein